MIKINESQKWPTDKAKYDKNYQKIFGMRCINCKFYKRGHANTCPIKCPYGKNEK